MPNTSATGGYLAPDGDITAPLDDAALDDFLGDLVAGVTGLDRDQWVRPRWQEEPPNLPPRTQDWAAVGVPDRTRDTYGAIIHQPATPDADGSDLLIRHEELRMLASFYGPNCQATATLLSDGLLIPQNREQLQLAGFGLKAVGDPAKAPEIIKGAWYSRCDLSVWFKREIRREYPVLNLLSAVATLYAPPVTRNIIAQP